MSEQYVKAVIDPNVVNRYRHVMQAYQGHFGAQLYTLKSTNIDPNYVKESKEGANGLRRPIKKYTIQPIDIIGIELAEDANGDFVIQFNGDSDLRFPARSPEFKKPTAQVVKEAIEAQRANSNAKPIFFTDRESLYKEISSLNKNNYVLYQNLVSKFSKEMVAMEGIMKAEDAVHNEYMRSCTLNDDVEVEVTIHKEVGINIDTED